MNTRRQFLQFAGGGFAAAWATSSRLVIGADEVPAGAVTFRMTPVGFFHKGESISGTL